MSEVEVPGVTTKRRFCPECERPLAEFHCGRAKNCIRCTADKVAKRKAAKEAKYWADKEARTLARKRELKRANNARAREVLKKKKREALKTAEGKAKETEKKEAAAKVRAVKKETKVDASMQRMAQRELAKRELARRRLLRFIERNQPAYQAGWVHEEICEELEEFTRAVEAKESPILAIFVPPRHGKSMIASWHYPAWYLGRNPDHEIIACSYAAPLALGFSRKARALCQDADFKALFPKFSLNKDAKAAENWNTDQGGCYRAAGVGGPITGTGGHILIIDDPVKNWEEAESETSREAVWNWFTSTAFTRLAPGGGLLIIQTRWHDDDLSGRLVRHVEKVLKKPIKIIEYPAEAIADEAHRKAGEALHPERFSAEALSTIKGMVGPRVWNALYQQQPTPDDGEYFNKDMLYYYDQLPSRDTLTFYAAWDLAISKREDADFTCGIVIGVDDNGNIYVVARYHGRWDSLEIIENIMDAQREWGPAVQWIEKEKLSMAIGPLLHKVLDEAKMHQAVIEEVPTGRKDKPLRARPLQGRMKQQKVRFPRNAAWAESVISEMLRFPNGKHDDQVDALALLASQLTHLVDVSPGKAKPQPISWKDKLARAFSPRSSNNYMTS